MMQEIARIALVGTSKHPAAGTMDTDHPAEAMVASLAVDNLDQTFLLRAGARAIFQQCGRRGRAEIPECTPCQDDDQPFAPAELIELIQFAISDSSNELLVDFLQLLHDHRLLLPPELLPQSLGCSDTNVRNKLLNVIGNRGRWLSQFQPEWQWVTKGVEHLSNRNRDELEKTWEEGSISERCEALRSLRSADPAAARAWLEAVANQEKADHLARLLGTLEIGLSTDDEAFLETRLDGRSEQVRRIAAGLLARIPGSKLSARMRERGDALLKAQRSGMLRKKLTLDIQPPESIDKSWERDGAPRKAPTGRGLRAVWIEWLLSSIPPSNWSNSFATDPERLIDAASGDDFAHPVLIGWTQATIAFASIYRESATWQRPLWKYWLDYELNARTPMPEPNIAQFMVGLVATMASPEDALLQLLRQSDKKVHSSLSACLAVIPRPWSENFGREYLTTTRRVLERGSNDSYPWASTLSVAGRALPPSLFAAALREWRLPSDDSKIWYAQSTVSAVEHFKETIQTRQRFAEQVNKFIANQAHSTAHFESIEKFE